MSEDGSGNRGLHVQGTHGTFGIPPSLRLTCGSCNFPFSIPSPETLPGRTNAVIAILSGRNASEAAGLIKAKCPHCHKVTSVGPAYARSRWVTFTIFTVIALIIAISVTAGTAEAAKSNSALYFLWSANLQMHRSNFLSLVHLLANRRLAYALLRGLRDAYIRHWDYISFVMVEEFDNILALL
ncbi:unnamed protein product [Trichobilharzia regenti]|nr:unnamed protein product [Trichobilharzia regenti]